MCVCVPAGRTGCAAEQEQSWHRSSKRAMNTMSEWTAFLALFGGSIFSMPSQNYNGVVDGQCLENFAFFYKLCLVVFEYGRVW